MNNLLGKLFSVLRGATFALLVVALGIFGLALGLALLGLRQPAERYAGVATEVAVLFACVFGLLAAASLAAAAVRWMSSPGTLPELTAGKP
jgi:hypothetical protein